MGDPRHPREMLQLSRAIELAIGDWWGHARQVGPGKWRSAMSKLRTLLLGDGLPQGQARSIALLNADAYKVDVIGRGLFWQMVFQLADAWCDTANEHEYVKFLRDTITRCVHIYERFGFIF